RISGHGVGMLADCPRVEGVDPGRLHRPGGAGQLLGHLVEGGQGAAGQEDAGAPPGEGGGTGPAAPPLRRSRRSCPPAASSSSWCECWIQDRKHRVLPMTDLPTGTVTFLFTDIEGSTGLLQSLGDRYPAVLDEHAAILRRAVAEAGGIEVSTHGDAFFVVFASPAGAVRAAVAAQRALAANDWSPGPPVRV